jgi:DNA-binding beta-propeller fold protein YncE
MLLRKLLITAAALTLSASLAIAQPAFLTKWGSLGAANGQFNLPWGVAVSAATGNVFVADQNNHRVQVFDGDGGFLYAFGSFGSGAGQFDLPYGIALDAADNVYVTEIGNSRVQKLSSAGAPISSFGSLGSGNGLFNTPSGILIHSSGEIYVSDGLNHRIQRFSAAGAFLQKWGTFGSPAGAFRVPMGIAEDADGNLFVADQGNHRVQKFSPTGGYLLQFGTRGQSDLHFSFPQGVAIDGAGAVYVADMGNHRVKIYDTLGNWVVNFGSMGTGDGQFNFPLGIGVDADDNIFVAELDNSRVQKFGEIPPLPPVAPAAVQVLLDVMPGTYPNVIEPSSTAPVTIALLGGEDFDIAQIRTATVRLHGMSPYLMAIGDVGVSFSQTDDCHMSMLSADGIDDVVFKFRVNDVLTAIPTWKEGETRLLTVSGELKDGTAFSATDCVSLKWTPSEASQSVEVVELGVRPQSPVRHTNVIEYAVPERSRVSLSVYDITGRRVATLIDDWVAEGRHQLDWNATGLASGVYFVRMNVGEQSVTRRVALHH